MSAPFQIGDRVRINNPDHEDHDQVGTVTGIDDLNPAWPFDVLIDGDSANQANCFDASELVLVERAS